MTTLLKHTRPALLALLVTLPAAASAQEAPSNGMIRPPPVLKPDIVIPEKSVNLLQPAPAQPGAANLLAGQGSTVVHAAQPRTVQPAANGHPEFGRATAQPRSSATTATAPAPKTAKDERHERMILEMRHAVQSIAAQYGNPSFAHVFTNDTLRAQLLRKRVHLLQRIDDVHAEIAALEKQKAGIKSELDASRAELLAVQKQTTELNERLARTRLAASFSTPTFIKEELIP